MLRSGASRNVLRVFNAAANPALTSSRSPVAQQWRSQMCTIARRPQVLAAAKRLATSRVYSDRKPIDNIDNKTESNIAGHKLEARPGEVSGGSTVHPIMDEVGGGRGHVENETDMMAGVKSDLKTIRETFSLQDVPREAYYMGMAGVLPYLATSLTTVFCASEIKTAAEHGTGLLLNERTAELLLHVIEPLQVGYGAVILSFLGAIHWGLEWAHYHGRKGYARYNIGVISTALAWPTILMPVEYALISQFLIFNFMYYTDSRASKRGWAPAWYGVYRFVLTFVVGSAIVISLIGRGQIADRISKPSGPAERLRQLRANQYVELEEEEEARRKFLAEKDEAAEEEDGEQESEDGADSEGGDDKDEEGKDEKEE